MINPTNISDIVTETLKRMDVREPSIVNLIKGTYAAESNLSEFYHEDLVTMAFLRPPEVKLMFNETLRYNQRLKDRIRTATDIDINTMSFDGFVFQLKANLAFSTAFLYVFYSNQFKEIPENDIDSIARAYMNYFVKEDDIESEKHFKETFNTVFR